MTIVKCIMVAGVGIVGLSICAGVTAAEGDFDIEAPYGFVGPIPLKDDRLFAVDRMTMTRLFSADAGRTWEQAGPLLDPKGQPVLGKKEQRGHLPSLLRLASGAIALKYNVPGTGGNLSKLSAYVMQSMDEAETWSQPVLVPLPKSRSNATWLIQTRKGRLVLPNEYWFAQSGDRGIGICTTVYSDTDGRSWRESSDALWVWENGGARQGACEVPTVVETADGRLLMFMRTWYQRIAQSYSKDGGQTWSPARLNDLVSSNSEIFLARIPNTNDLLCIWNQADTQEIENGFYRARLTAAISKDSGGSWMHFRTFAESPGQRKLSRVSPLSPPRFLRTPIPVPKKEKMLDQEFHMNRAPRIHFVGDRVFVRYTHRRYKYVDGKLDRFVNQTRLRAMATDWFYERQ
jgi:hypothetical protein